MKLRTNSPIGKWTNMGWTGCRSGLPSSSSLNMTLFLGDIGPTGGRELPPFLFRHARDADPILVNHSSTQIGRHDQDQGADDRQQQRYSINLRGFAKRRPTQVK